MPGRVIGNVFASTAIRHSTRSAPTLRCARYSVAAPIPPSPDAPSPPSSSTIEQTKAYASLQHSLREGDPNAVWASYGELLNDAGYTKLPLEVHQQVLRKCTPDVHVLRQEVVDKLQAGRRWARTRGNDARFKEIFANIAAAGRVPSLDDFHFVLWQFAATGFYATSYSVYQELLRAGHIPTEKTVGFCLQALAFRQTLPVLPKDEAELDTRVRSIYGAIVDDMKKYGIPWTSQNMDLSMRILKDKLDLEALQEMLKSAYGIDLSYPDKAPLELQEQGTPRQTFLPFSLAAFNTTLDILGRLGHISKMVQAFEVLSQPIPTGQDHFFSTFDEDEDDVGAILASNKQWKPPSVVPNTTTYTILMRHIGKANHSTFARHYLVDAMQMDRQSDFDLRLKLYNRKPRNLNFDPQSFVFHDIPAPRFMLTRTMMQPAMSHSSRTKDMGLLRWMKTKIVKVIRLKENDLAFYKSVLHRAQKWVEYLAKVEAEAARAREAGASPSQEPAVPSPEIPQETTQLREDEVAQSSSEGARPAIEDENGELGPEADQSETPSLKPNVDSGAKFKPLRLPLHIELLEREVESLKAFKLYLDDLYGRTQQRTKERIGRRVWKEKDVWMPGSQTRRPVTREEWQETVYFPPRTGPHMLAEPQEKLQELDERRAQRGWNQGKFFEKNSRSFSTAFAGLSGSPAATACVAPQPPCGAVPREGTS